MLISFSFKNLFSFKDETTFSMVSGRAQKMANQVISINESIDALKFSAIYGANASGKSNFIKCMYEFGFLILNGPHQYKHDYSFLGNAKENNSAFECLLCDDENNILKYGFEYSYRTNKFVAEWLSTIEKSEEKRVFERNIAQGTFVFEVDLDQKDVERIKIYRDDLKKDGRNLFTKYIYNKKKFFSSKVLKIVASIYEWVEQKLEVTFPEDTLTSPKYYYSTDGLDQISNFLKKYDTGIDHLDKQIVDISDFAKIAPTAIFSDIKERFSKPRKGFMTFHWKDNYYIFSNNSGQFKIEKIVFVHLINNKKVMLTFAQESDGTIRLLQLAAALLSDETGKTFFIDEFDRCLHPLAVVQFVKDFLKNTDSNNQLIITTHESLLMDLQILRRDEIWFVEKTDGISALYSLEEFQKRFDTRVNKQYLEGRYGAIPVFQDSLGEIITDENIFEK